MPEPHEQDPSMLGRAFERMQRIGIYSSVIGAGALSLAVGGGAIQGELSTSNPGGAIYQTGPTPLENIDGPEKQLARKALTVR